MVHVSTFIYAQDSNTVANTEGGNSLHLINPQHIFTPAFIPSLFSFAIMFGILGIEQSKEHKIRVVFRGPNPNEGPILDTGDFNYPANDQGKDLPLEMQGFLMNLNLRNVPLKYEGEYATDIYADGILLGTFPIKVKGKQSV
jgi:hypothetical protein